MKTSAAFLMMLALGTAGGFAVLRLADRTDESALRAEPPLSSELLLAGHPTTFALSHALAARTSLQVSPAWPAGTLWEEQAETARQSSTEWQAMARTASIVVTLRGTVHADALFAAVRALNPRVVEIDASVAADQQTPSVRLLAGTATNPSFALSPTNAIQLAERIAADMTALNPGNASIVAENLRSTKERLLRLKAKFEQEFARLSAPEVVVFSSDFDYLCEDFGIQVVERFSKDFASWSEGEQRANHDRLQLAGARVSLHGFPPSPELAALLARAKITPVVLDPLNQTSAAPDAFFVKLEKNLGALKLALTP